MKRKQHPLLEETRIESSVPTLLWQHCCRKSTSESTVKLHRTLSWSFISANS